MGARADRTVRFVDEAPRVGVASAHATRRSHVRTGDHLRRDAGRRRAWDRARPRGRRPGHRGERRRDRTLGRRSRTREAALDHGLRQRGGGEGGLDTGRRAGRRAPRRAAEAELGRALRDLRERLMPTIRAHAEGPATPERFVEVLTDFSEARLERWPNLRGRFVLHELGDGWAEVTEGSTV